jgi:hypothetical protein
MIGLYGHGMHDFIVRECEVGTRVALAEDDEACGFGPLFDLQVSRWERADRLFGVGFERRTARSAQVGPCPCACNSGGFCGGCGHAGCGGRR